MIDPRHVATKHVLRYLRGTIGYGLKYTFVGGVRLFGYTDSDWAGIVVDRNSTSGYCFSMGSTMISWSARKPFGFVISLRTYLEMCLRQQLSSAITRAL